MKNYRFEGTITILSPLAHNSDESAGTDTKFRRMSIFCEKKRMEIPVYSGNAFRGIFRRLAARQFCDRLGFEKLSDKLYYCFFTGGSLQKGAAQNHIDIGKKRKLREKIPFLSLLGSAVSNQIIPGKLQVDMGVPIAKETTDMTGIISDLTIWEMTDEIFYTRRDDLEDRQDEQKQAQQMKYNIEVLVPGVVMTHGFVLSCVNEIEAGCFTHAIQKMQDVGILGGKSGTGHGRVKLEYEPEWPDEKPYLDFLGKEKTKIVEYVRGLETVL